MDIERATTGVRALVDAATRINEGGSGEDWSAFRRELWAARAALAAPPEPPLDDTVRLLRTGEAELLSDAELKMFRDYADGILKGRGHE